MKVAEVNNERMESFADVKRGESFMDKQGGLFMKITPTCDAEDADNAVNLKEGYGCMFMDEEEVKSVDARVVVFQR